KARERTNGKSPVISSDDMTGDSGAEHRAERRGVSGGGADCALEDGTRHAAAIAQGGKQFLDVQNQHDLAIGKRGDTGYTLGTEILERLDDRVLAPHEAVDGENEGVLGGLHQH